MRRSFGSIVLAATFFTALASEPLRAGVVYVALAADVELRGVRYATELRVSNPTDTPRSFTTYFIATNANGTTGRPDPFQPPSSTVPPGETRVLRNLAPAGQTGMLEIESEPALAFSARLVPNQGGNERDGAAVAVVSSANLVPGGRAAFLQGLARDADRTSTLGVINLSKADNDCTVALIGAQAAAVVASQPFRLQPLSQAFFPDVLGFVGVQAQAEVRFEISCQGAAFVFGHVLNARTAEVVDLLLAGIGDSTLTPPGGDAACPPGALCFEEEGVFHVASPGDEVWERRFALEPGQVFRRLRVEVTVQHGGWDSEQPDGIHNLFWVYRNQWRSNNFGFVNLRGPNRFVLTNNTNVNLAAGETRVSSVRANTEPGQVYRVIYTYDAANTTIETILTRLDGTEVARMVDQATANEIRTQGAGFIIWCGQTRSNAEVPTYGWTYSDLVFQLIP